jgi:hypothetical protein
MGAPGLPVRPPRGVLAAARRSPRYAPSRLLATTFGRAPRTAVIWSRLQIMPGRQAFLRRRHVAAGASRANHGPRVPARAWLLSVAVPACWMALLPRRFRCSGRRRPCAPGWLAAGDLGSCDCRHRYPAEVALEPAALPPVPSPLSVVRLRLSVDEEVLDVGRFHGVDRLQITCHRRSKNPRRLRRRHPKMDSRLLRRLLAHWARASTHH